MHMLHKQQGTTWLLLQPIQSMPCRLKAWGPMVLCCIPKVQDTNFKLLTTAGPPAMQSAGAQWQLLNADTVPPVVDEMEIDSLGD